MTESISPICIASIQLCSQTDIDANLHIIEQAIKHAANLGARLIVLPENACVMGRQHELAQRFDEMCAFFSSLAKQTNTHLVAGTLPCPKRPDGSLICDNKYRQSSLLFDNNGQQIARYDKIHLFRATVNDSTGSYDEGRTFEAGERLVVAPCYIDNQLVHVGMMICFDVRFAAMATRLRQMGADIITVPAAFTFQTGQAHWQTLLQARALDSQCFMVGSAQGGTHHIGSSTRQTWGYSMLIDAHARQLASTACTDSSDDYLIAIAEFNSEQQTKIRQHLPIFDCHRLG